MLNQVGLITLQRNATTLLLKNTKLVCPKVIKVGLSAGRKKQITKK